MPRNSSRALDGENALGGDAFPAYPFLNRLLTNTDAPGKFGLAAHGLDGFVNGCHAAGGYRHCLSKCKASPVGHPQAQPVGLQPVVKSKTKPGRPELQRLGAAIAAAREAADLSQSQLAEELGVAQQTVGQWEGGQVAIGVEKLSTLADKLHTTIARLFGENPAADESQLVTIHNLVMPIEAARLGQQWHLMDEPARSLYRDLIYLIVAAQKRQPAARKKAKGKPIGIRELLDAVADLNHTAT
jgi:transcriptional regulator with XRE-family HTH domain